MLKNKAGLQSCLSKCPSNHCCLPCFTHDRQSEQASRYFVFMVKKRESLLVNNQIKYENNCRLLIRLAGTKECTIFCVVHEVHAVISAIKSMSAHGEYEDSSQCLACQIPAAVEKLFLAHGEYKGQLAF